MSVSLEGAWAETVHDCRGLRVGDQGGFNARFRRLDFVLDSARVGAALPETILAPLAKATVMVSRQYNHASNSSQARSTRHSVGGWHVVRSQDEDARK
jgi:hypothetical protein